MNRLELFQNTLQAKLAVEEGIKKMYHDLAEFIMNLDNVFWVHVDECEFGLAEISIETDEYDFKINLYRYVDLCRRFSLRQGLRSAGC